MHIQYKGGGKHGFCIDVLKRAIAVKYGNRPWNTLNGIDWAKVISYIPIIFLSLFVSEKSKKRYDKLQTKYNNQKEFKHYYVAGVSRVGRWLVKREILDSLTTIKFEDEVFSCPANSDEYLSSTYGDYMTLPPVEKRQFGHSIIEVKFKDGEQK